MGLLSGILGGRSLDAILRRAKSCLAAGNFDEGLKVVESGLARFGHASVLRDTGHLIRRAQARAGMQALKDRIDQDSDPDAHAQLIALYRDVGMESEQIRATERFIEEHPDRDLPHLLRGEQLLETFLADLRSRDGRAAIDRLLRAGALQPDALRPRVMLAEIYYAIGADKALLGQSSAIQRLAGDDEVFAPILSAILEVAKSVPNESVDALLATVEVAGRLTRDPSTWSGRKRKGIASETEGSRLQRGLEKLVDGETADEAVAIDRSGALVGHAGRPGTAAGSTDSDEDSALAGVARAVARTIKVQARELEMGAFRRCIVEGPFGVMVVADASGGVVAARAGRGVDPHRLSDRLAVAVDGIRGRRIS